MDLCRALPFRDYDWLLLGLLFLSRLCSPLLGMVPSKIVFKCKALFPYFCPHELVSCALLH